MTALISILRGVNLGSANRIKMDALRDLYSSLDLVDPQTYIQSGNVVCGTKRREKDLTKIAARISDTLASQAGIRSAVILRTTEDMRDIVARNPFAHRPDVPPNKLAVIFLATEPAKELMANLDKRPPGPEELHLSGRELYVYYPLGFGQSKLTPPLIDRALKTTSSARNWNTVTKLLELAEKWEAARG